MEKRFISFSRLAWLVGLSILVMVTNVVASVVYMVVYGHIIDPGHDPQYYSDHIQVAAPYCSIVAGIPLMFAAGWLAGRWWRGEFAIKSAVTAWLVYAVIDVAILIASGMTSWLAVLAGISILTKLAAVCLGAIVSNSGSRPADALSRDLN
jgi:hypothetical protein